MDAPKPKLKINVEDENSGLKCCLKGYVDMKDESLLVTLESGRITLMLLSEGDDESITPPAKFFSEEAAIEEMTEIATEITMPDVDMQFRIEEIRSVGDREVKKFCVTMVVNDYYFLVVSQEGITFRYLFFNSSPDAELIIMDIAQNLGGVYITGTE